MSTSIRWFDTLGMADVPVVGGKNASLGEMRRALTSLGIRTPDGFATTADAYRSFLQAAGLDRVIAETLNDFDVTAIDRLQAAGAHVRSAILAATLPPSLVSDVTEAYRRLEAEYGANCDVRSTAAPPPKTCPRRASPGSRRPTSTFTARPCSPMR